MPNGVQVLFLPWDLPAVAGIPVTATIYLFTRLIVPICQSKRHREGEDKRGFTAGCSFAVLNSVSSVRLPRASAELWDHSILSQRPGASVQERWRHRLERLSVWITPEVSVSDCVARIVTETKGKGPIQFNNSHDSSLILFCMTALISFMSLVISASCSAGVSPFKLETKSIGDCS